ncbi:uncharacterized protein N7515_005146 [Penicillium bovifimosum]|uniref:MYND-type domain-containing protein n=1 Tax=Penicillium bovifimosum TaxID=126998 RepID=A0A9W9H1U4_9EURO|nr:uncharacterized protein N7515_005146 [Penicillium bovifimosum]KAJ5135868.1 hypothetical protein N7515_005146 [Penicillium bovifimosum]
MTSSSPPPPGKGLTCSACGKPECPQNILNECRCEQDCDCSRGCHKADWEKYLEVCLPTSQSQSPASATTDSTPPPSSALQAKPAVTATVAGRMLEAPAKPSTAPCDINHLVSTLDVDMKTPFSRLAAKIWLQGRTQKDVFTLLIDTIHLRAMEDKQLAVQTIEDVITASRIHADRMVIVRFLTKAESKNLLPIWWSSSKQDECVRFSFALEHDRAFPEPSAQRHHEAKKRAEVASSLLLQMRIFAEQVYGPIPGKPSVMLELGRSMLKERDELLRDMLAP